LTVASAGPFLTCLVTTYQMESLNLNVDRLLVVPFAEGKPG
jgi:hypothetical protein